MLARFSEKSVKYTPIPLNIEKSQPVCNKAEITFNKTAFLHKLLNFALE